MVTIFAIAMAYMESATVVYLRTIFHITGDLLTFSPNPHSVWLSLTYFTLLKTDALLKVLPQPRIAATEVAREAATIVMLLCLGWLAGHSVKTRAAYFIYAFGVWDIAYYGFLYALIGWPTSLKSLDVLFLIPSPWVAPALVPTAISAGMIAVAALLLWTDRG